MTGAGVVDVKGDEVGTDIVAEVHRYEHAYEDHTMQVSLWFEHFGHDRYQHI